MKSKTETPKPDGNQPPLNMNKADALQIKI